MLAADLSDVQLDDLRSCAKRRESSTREKRKGKHFERQHELVSVNDPNLRFRVFIRQNAT